MSDFGWKAHVEYDPMSDTDRVVLYRRMGDGTQVVTGFDREGRPEATTFAPGTATSDVGLRLPAGALTAIAEAVKPGPATAELGVLREWLDAERSRTDRLIEASLTQGGRRDV